MTHHQQFEHHEHPHDKPCRVCSAMPDERGHIFGLCRGCIYKILIVFFIIMISISYVAWFGVL